MPNNPIPIPGTVQSAPPGLHGFDVNDTISAAQAANYKAARYGFCSR